MGDMMDKVNMDELECLKDRLITSEKIEKVNEPVDIILSLIGLALPAADGLKAMKDIVVGKFNNFQNSKREEFCKMVLSDTSMITSDKVQDVTFIMEFLRTMDVIKRVSQNDKVAYIARLFKKSFVIKSIDEFDVDQYEEYLHRLDYLSIKEIDLLISLYKYSNENQKEYHDEWNDFKVMIANKLAVQESDIVSIFSGLCMTGFCREYKVMFPSKGGREDPFIITDYFRKFVSLICD